MGKSQRDKGNRGERAVVNMFKAAGYSGASRNYADKVDGDGVDVTAGPWVIQVKHYKGGVPMSKYGEIKRQGLRALVSKQDRQDWMVTMRLDDLLEILKDVGVAWENTK
jgi:hypothetical protein